MMDEGQIALLFFKLGIIFTLAVINAISSIKKFIRDREIRMAKEAELL